MSIIENAEGAEKTNLEIALADYQAQMANDEAEKYVVTQEELAAYRRDTLPYLRALGPAIYQDTDRLSDTSFVILLRRFIDG